MVIKILFPIILILCFSIIVSGQDTLTYSQTQNIEEAQKFKNGQQFKVYILKDSSILNIGDTLVIGTIASSTATTSSTLGTTLTQNVYTTAWAGTFSDAVMYGVHFLSEGWKGKKFVIQDIKVRHTELSKKSQVVVYATAKTVGDKKSSYTLSIDYGIDNGEIINPKSKMTKVEALAKLKEAKELLDLGLMKQAQYDSLKVKLPPIILKQ